MIVTPVSTLLQAAGRDTVVALAGRDALGLAVDLSLIVVAAAVVLTALLVARFLARADGVLKDTRERVVQSLGPVSERTRTIAANVEAITQALRADVERLSSSVNALTNRLHQASGRMEERIEEFNALMEVVQGEAEDIFIDTASTVRGVRTGAHRMVRPGRSPEDDGMLTEGDEDAAALPANDTRAARLEEDDDVDVADVDGRPRGATS
jgi:hypothetical protein